MTSGNADLSDGIYRRVYRLVKRNLSVSTIAATIKLPTETVQNIVNRFLDKTQNNPDASTATGGKDIAGKHQEEEILEVFVFPKSRHAVVDVVGMVTGQFAAQLKTELDRIISSGWKAVAIKMADVSSVDEKGMSVLIDFCIEFNSKGRYSAILDPALDIEKAIETMVEKHRIPIFGTERAFEEKAFAGTTVRQRK